METITLSTPEVIPQKLTTDYRVVALLLDWEGSFIQIRLRGTNNESKDFRYEGATATTMMIGLNKANLSLKSLHRRIIERLITDGLLAGAVSGNPD